MSRKKTEDGAGTDKAPTTATQGGLSWPALVNSFEVAAKRAAEPLDAAAVRERKGKGTDRATGKPIVFRYISGGDVKAALYRVFGSAGWSYHVVDQNHHHAATRQEEKGTGRVVERHTVSAWARVRLTIGNVQLPLAHREDVGVQVAADQPTLGDALDLALKGAVTDGLKRAAASIGPAFGLGLMFEEDEAVAAGYIAGPPAADRSPEPAPKPEPAKRETVVSGQAPGLPGPVEGKLPPVAQDRMVQAAQLLLEGKLPPSVTALLAAGVGPGQTASDGGVTPSDPDETDLIAAGVPKDRAVQLALLRGECDRIDLARLHAAALESVGKDEAVRRWADVGVKKGGQASAYQARLYAVLTARKAR